MHYLGLALYAEGPADYRFLSPLLLRLCEDICLRRASEPVDISNVLALDDRPETIGLPRGERIGRAAKDAVGSWQVLFVHSDGAGDPIAARQNQIDPALAFIRGLGIARGEGVAIVPVRETESWMLADGDSLRSVFGTTLDNGSLGLPSTISAVELVTDPKQAIEFAFAATKPRARRARSGAAASFAALGEQASLQRLRGLPSFRALEGDLLSALEQLRIIPSPTA